MVSYVTKKGDMYWPSEEMKKIAWVRDPNIYEEARKNPIKFWEKLAEEGIVWESKWKKGYQEKYPYFNWFKGGKLNFSVNAVDRHLSKGNKTALIWIPEPVNEPSVKITYAELYEKVNKFANVLKSLGVKRGEAVSIYLPMLPQAVIAMLACTRIGAIHSVVFSAFAPDALKARIQDAEAKILITSDGYYRRGERQDLLKKAKKAIRGTSIKKVIVVKRTNKNKILFGKYLDFDSLIEKADAYCEPEMVNSEDPMFIF